MISCITANSSGLMRCVARFDFTSELISLGHHCLKVLRNVTIGLIAQELKAKIYQDKDQLIILVKETRKETYICYEANISVPWRQSLKEMEWNIRLIQFYVLLTDALILKCR